MAFANCIEKCSVCTRSITPQDNSCTSTSCYGISNQKFASVDSVRDVGVNVDCQFKFDKHIASIVHKAMKRANLILKTFHSRDTTLLTNYQGLHIFTSYIRVLLSCLHQYVHFYSAPITTRCSAIAERPRCRVRYSFRQK